MKRIYAVLVATVLILGFTAQVGNLAGLIKSDSEGVRDQSFDQVRHFTLQDGLPAVEEYSGYTETPLHQPLDIQVSDDSKFHYMACSPYYKVYFKGARTRMVVQDAWIEFELVNQELGELGIEQAPHVMSKNTLSVSDVFTSVDLSYEVGTSLLRETLTLEEPKTFERVVQEIRWDGLVCEVEEDGSMLFLLEDGDGKAILKILPPFMEDNNGSICTDIHYELIETEKGYELHKVIDEEGLKWLKEAVYPVTIDPSMQTLEDAWESSGLTPYGQYFKNLKEYVNPANGHLTVSQTDLVIPGRGLDLVISRVYEMPAVFYGYSPYDYEDALVDVGNGWQLGFPFVGSKYLHLWNGTIYKMVWVNDVFENHKGTHFVLVKNGDATYTLTTANGIVYQFSNAGKLLSIKDVDENTITFTYESGFLTSITDTIGRTVTLTYTGYNRLHKIIYNGAEIEYGYDGYGCLASVDDFLDRRTSYEYNAWSLHWLLSKVTYPTTGYTTYVYDRFQDGDYYKYFVTDQRVYETNQVRHCVHSYTGTFAAFTGSTTTVKNESDITEGFYTFTVSDGLITQKVIKNASGTPLRKYTYVNNSSKEVTQEGVYNDGSNLSYTNYYSYDNWGNTIYIKNAEGHEQFFSYANTSTSGFFMDNTGTVIQNFTNAFTNSSVPSSVHTALLGSAEKQDATYVREAYITYDSEAHPTQSKSVFGNATTYLTFSGTFNEKTGSTSFPIDLTGHTVTGNAVLQITGLPSDDTYTETKYTTCPINANLCRYSQVLYSWWSTNYCKVNWVNQYVPTTGTSTIGPFTHYPGTLGYSSYIPSAYSATTYWKAYPVQVQYNLDLSDWNLITSNLKNLTKQIPITITDGSHTLYFSESSSQNTKFTWTLYVPVDNTPDTYITSMTYDTYGNVTSITDAESNTISFTYSSTYSSAYLTEISITVGQDTITTKATYDSNRGWITSLQQPKGVAGSGYDMLYTYDLLGRITKKEFPLLPGQSQRAYLEAIYDDTNRTVTIIDSLRHYIVQEYDRLGWLTSTNSYTGVYGSGTLCATTSYTYQYDSRISTITDPGNDVYTYSYDFLGRITQVLYPGSVSISCSYDNTNNKITFTNGRQYDTIYWFNWLFQLTKIEEEYAPDLFATTTYQYDEIGHLTSFTDAETHTTTYTYASLFGLTRTQYPDFTYEEYLYDNMGNVTSFTDAKGNDTTFVYDEAYRLTQLQYQDQSISFTYDLNSNKTRMDDNAPNTGDYVEYTYDEWNRLIDETRHISQDTYTVSCQYDVASRLTNLTYPDNMQIQYSYDDLNRTVEIKRYIDGVNDEILMDNIQYNTESLLAQIDFGNDLRATFSYDSLDRLSSLDVMYGATSYLDLDYTFDDNNNITQLVNGWRDTEFTWHSETESYTYDGLDRLISANCQSWSHTFSYDKAGNRITKDGVTSTINAVNEVTSMSDGTSFSYDMNGNRTQITKDTDIWLYTYDSANRLTILEKNSEILGEYAYDGSSRRIQMTENDVTTTYIYAGLNVVFEENSTGAAAYIYGPTGRLAKRTTINGETNMFYFHTDHLGSTRLVTDSSRNIVSALTYHPFGETCIEEGSEKFQFTGKEKDASGLHYFGARYYDSQTGTFITRDPLFGDLRNPKTLNRYTYCANNPLKYIDLTGLSWEHVDEIVADMLSDEVEELNPGDEGHPGEDYLFGGGQLLFDTPVYKCGDMGVAIATYNIPGKGVDNGLVIITYGIGDEILDIVFYSFGDLLDGIHGFDDFLTWLQEKNINLEQFDLAREALESYCSKMDEKYGSEGLAADIGGIGLGLIAVKCVLLAPLAWIVGGYGIERSAKNSIWDERENQLGDLGDTIKNKIIEELKGG